MHCAIGVTDIKEITNFMQATSSVLTGVKMTHVVIPVLIVSPAVNTEIRSKVVKGRLYIELMSTYYMETFSILLALRVGNPLVTGIADGVLPLRASD